MAHQSTVQLSGGLSNELATCTATISRNASMALNTDKAVDGRVQRNEFNVFTLA